MIKDNSKKGSENAIENMRHYGSNNVFFIITKRTQKIVTALYMVTEFLDDHDPIKEEIRSLSVVLLSDTFQCTDMSFTKKTQILTSAVAVVETLMSFMKVARRVGSLSDMNTSILAEELRKLKTLMEEEIAKLIFSHDVRYKSLAVQNATLPIDVFLDEENSSDTVAPQAPTSARTKNFVKDRFTTSSELEKKNSPMPTHVKGQDSHETVVSFTKRQQDILQLFKTKKEMKIKEVAQHIKDCSEKTIQRELTKLVQQGVLYKKGEKRWSSYILVS